MSVYRCEMCDCTKDADFDGCNEHAKNEFAMVCDACHEDHGCHYCGKASLDTVYCKITDQYYHEECI